jgi:hypothetical protein
MQPSVLEEVGKVLDCIVAHMRRFCTQKSMSSVDIDGTWHAAKIEDDGKSLVWNMTTDLSMFSVTGTECSNNHSRPVLKACISRLPTHRSIVDRDGIPTCPPR